MGGGRAMTTSSLIGSFGRRPELVAAADYWIHLEQVRPEDDSASLGEVAELVDAIWGTLPCGQEADPAAASEEPADPAAPPIDQAALAAIVRANFHLPALCSQNATGDYQTQIKVAIAHPGERYTLRLTNGKIGQTVTVEEELNRTIVVQDAASVTLDFPVLSGGSFAWRGSVWGSGGNGAGPEIVQAGRTLAWGEPVTGSLAI